MLLGALGFPLPLLRLRLSSGRPTPSCCLIFDIGNMNKDVGEDRILFVLTLVSTYHYKSFQDVKFNEELVKMFLTGSFAAVFVGIMNQGDAVKCCVNNPVANDVFIGFVEIVAGLDKQTQQIIH